ncbi:aminotransferase class V-fold PLP-dependent enzyme [Duganella qianjiadongensis]|uniref:cysteine desulfurase n=1 Tax=Duganella qianjiadongensis TaxID=2692176 RepID=A0ABW9VQV8_9BURK|nr:aminotransferase class V-fold PLP-dependent enzyme [Duganella qianjiadongensis]MYM41566.1 aminotransferase class V-fold PLP-dependent enzyme [Duganella qianjiadongensis]
MTTEIYLDGNATSPVLPAAIAAATCAMGQRYGNPSSSHAAGLSAKALLDQARQCARRLLGVGDGRLMFNSGATEGIQTAVLSALVALRERREQGEAIGSLLVYGATEHKAVPESLAHWNRLLGLNLTLHKLPVNAQGMHDLAALRACAAEAALVCTMAANNETGVISDIAGIQAVLEQTGCKAYWMVDCVQALGKLALNLAATRIDYAPFSGHKLYAPKGIGMLYVRAGAPFTPLIVGGGQESAQRSGTENMAGIAALGTVLAALERGDTFRSHDELEGYRARLADALREALPGIVFNNPFENSLPTTLNFSVPGLSSRELMDVFDAAQVRVSSGSACSAAKAAPSYVLDAMQVPLWRSAGAIRMSFGPLIDAAMIDDACRRIARCGAALRSGCLIPSERHSTVHDGLLQMGVEGVCSWLVLDAASRSCVLIDPLPEHTGRIEAFVRCQNYRVQAILNTSAGQENGALLEALGRHAASRVAADAYGWPALPERVTLADGQSVAALQLGARTLACVSDGACRHYLLGAAVQGRLDAAAVRFAFSTASCAPALQGLTGAATLLCPSRDEHNQFCSGAAAADAVCCDSLQLDHAGLNALLGSHPAVELIDVREDFEYAASANLLAVAGKVQSVPLSRLTEHASSWLAAPDSTLVFICRSGNRSLKAAQCLRRLGHQHSYSLSGGLALAALAQAA